MNDDITRLPQLRQECLASGMDMLSIFSGGVAHHFNNLLAIMLLNCEIHRTEKQGTCREVLEIEAALKRGISIVRQLMTLSEPPSVRLTPCSIGELLKELTGPLQKKMRPKCEIRFEPADASSSVLLDREKIEAALLNVVENSCDAMPEGGVVTITSGETVVSDTVTRRFPWVTPGKFGTISVSDTGQGMRQEDIDTIFLPFFTTKAPSFGIGLGLATVYQTVKQHGGFITVASQVNEGTRIDIHLPIPAEMHASKSMV